MKKFFWTLGLLMVGASAVADDIMISWESTGILLAEGMEPTMACTVEWTSDLQDEFKLAPVAGLIADSNGRSHFEISALVSRAFFRVRGMATGSAPEGMVEIPAGINRGTNALDDGELYGENYPETYALTNESSFYMDATEVTKAQWDTVYNWAVTNGYSFANAGSGKASSHPVQKVNWYDCVKWCNARSEMDGRTPYYTLSGNVYKVGQSSPDRNMNANGYRLPTGDEWEYAARGGLSEKRFPWGDTITHIQANYYSLSSYSYDTSSTRNFNPTYHDNTWPYTSPAGSFLPNGYGLYDMAGNVWEWCDTASGPRRSIRGGSWYSSAKEARCYYEIWIFPDGRNNSGGFRSVFR